MAEVKQPPFRVATTARRMTRAEASPRPILTLPGTVPPMRRAR